MLKVTELKAIRHDMNKSAHHIVRLLKLKKVEVAFTVYTSVHNTLSTIGLKGEYDDVLNIWMLEEKYTQVQIDAFKLSYQSISRRNGYEFSASEFFD